MISVVIPLYNKEKFIATTIKSVLNQTYQNFEIVVVNDGSSDNSASEVKNFSDSRIRLINQENAGVSIARNRGIKEAHGVFVALLDADDEWMPDYLETQINLTLKYPEADVFTTNYEFRDSQGKVSTTIINKIAFNDETGILSNYFEVASASHPPICSISIMARKEAFLSIGGFPVGIKSGEDLLTWARLAARYKIAYNKSPKAIYNLGESYNVSTQPVRKQDEGDPVGNALIRLYNDNRNIKSLRQYLSHWYKMRASVSLRFGNRWETLCEACKSLYFRPTNIKVFLIMILAVCPSYIRKKIISLKSFH